MSVLAVADDPRTHASRETDRPRRESGDSCQVVPIRVVVAEDSYPIREFLTMILSSTPAVELAAVCSNGNELRTAVAASRPEVIVTNIRMSLADLLLPPPVRALRPTRRRAHV